MAKPKKASKKDAKKKAAPKGKSKEKAAKGAKKGKSKSEKKTDKVVQISVKHKKKEWMSERPIDACTGTRFKPGTSQQLAFDITYKMAKAGSQIKEIREALKNTRKDNGDERNLDAGYFNLVAACHEDFFTCYSDGTIKVKKAPKPDKNAQAEAKKKKEERKARASKTRGKKTSKKPVGKGKGKPKKRAVKKKK